MSFTRMDRNYIASGDMGIRWLNGNALSGRAAVGYRRSGTWTPAILAAAGLLWGQRIEVLNAAGERPGAAVWTAGLRATPLSFDSPKGFASALEIGYGIGPYKGSNWEVTLLSVGARF